MRKSTKLSHRLLKELVDRIVSRFQPDKVILFGSRARNGAAAHADLDLLVVMPVEGSPRRKAMEIAMVLKDAPTPIDVLVSTPDEFSWRKEIVGTVEHPASREGKILYDRK